MLVIPAITDPLGAHWQQPSPDDIAIDDTHALMTERTLNHLLDYSRSLPSGTYTGKMWRRSTGDGGWWLCWYGALVGKDEIEIHRREVLLA